jgi:hypothetical protein
VPIADLNGKTLNEVFIGGNVITDGSFTNGFTNWIRVDGGNNLGIGSQAMRFANTGSSNIDWEATKKSPDNVCVIKKGSPAHIVCFIGYDQDYLYIRNS